MWIRCSLFVAVSRTGARQATNSRLNPMVNKYVKKFNRHGREVIYPGSRQRCDVSHQADAASESDVKALTGRTDVDFEACYAALLEDKEQMRTFIPELLRSQLTNDASDPNDRLRLCLALSEVANYLRRLCESMIDAIPSEEKGD